MSLTLPVGGSSGDFKRVPAGTHLAVCVIVADLGLQPGSSQYPEPKRKIHLRFEIPSERVQYEKDGKMIDAPAVIGRNFTASMNSKATLRKFIEGWRGRAFTDAEAAKFDISALLGKACLLSVSESERGGEVYADIASASPLLKGLAPPPPESETILFTAESPDSVYDKLPKKLREKIASQLQPKSEQHVVEEAAQYWGDDDKYL
jgi:hypothetical protein